MYTSIISHNVRFPKYMTKEHLGIIAVHKGTSLISQYVSPETHKKGGLVMNSRGIKFPVPGFPFKGVREMKRIDTCINIKIASG